MKSLKSLSILLAVSQLTACCKGAYPVAGITVQYPNISSSKMLKAIRTNRNNLTQVIDTIVVAELNSTNQFSAIIELEENSPNYILYVENTSYQDTITAIQFERKGCKQKIKDFHYHFNGENRTENQLTIN